MTEGRNYSKVTVRCAHGAGRILCQSALGLETLFGNSELADQRLVLWVALQVNDGVGVGKDRGPFWIFDASRQEAVGGGNEILKRKENRIKMETPIFLQPAPFVVQHRTEGYLKKGGGIGLRAVVDKNRFP